jgi:hypothetical protein
MSRIAQPCGTTRAYALQSMRYFMAMHHCVICSEPVDLAVDPCDETGNPVHEKCYVDHITGKSDTVAPPPQMAIALNPALIAIAFV